MWRMWYRYRRVGIRKIFIEKSTINVWLVLERPWLFLFHVLTICLFLRFSFAGNLANVITICRMRHLKNSFVLYVALLAIVDNLALCVKILFYQLLLHKVPIGSLGCRLLEFLGNFLVTYCSWILVIMAIERLIAVRYPFKIQFQTCLSSTKAAIAVGVVGATIACVYVPVLWTSKFVDDKRCHKENKVLVNVMQWTSVSMYAVIPFVLLTVCNFLIAHEIRMSFRLRNSFRSIYNFTVNRRSSDLPLQRQIMIMLFTTTCMFIILHFPICVLLVANSRWVVAMYTRAWGIKFLCRQLAYVLCDSNHAINFYLYFLSGRKFRAHFTRMFSSCPKRRKLVRKYTAGIPMKAQNI